MTAAQSLLPSSVDQYTAVLGVLLPLLIAAINRAGWPAPAKSSMALAVCLGAAALELVVKGQWALTNFGGNLLTIFFLVVTSYQGFWKPTGISDAVEKRTG